jgi:hypothetical protein
VNQRKKGDESDKNKYKYYLWLYKMTLIKWLSPEIHRKLGLKAPNFIAYFHKRDEKQFVLKSEKQLFLISVQIYKYFKMNIYNDIY